MIVCALAACRNPNYPVVAGDTELHVSRVTIVPRAGEVLEADYKPLLGNLGLRPKAPLRPERRWNPFRLAEDRRRIAAYVMEHGHYEGIVDEPQLVWNAAHTSVAVRWPVHEGPTYRIGSVAIHGAPTDQLAALTKLLPFEAGDPVDMVAYRPLRGLLADHLRAAGYGHARGWSRAFVDRTTKTVAWFYYLDPGPQTTIGSLAVEGNAHVPIRSVLERAGLAPGRPFSTTDAKRAELALLDTGAFASVNVTSDADVPHVPEYPEVGGQLAAEQVSPTGGIVPRPLSSELAVRVVVVEAPQESVRGELGIEGDPGRVDVFTGVRTVLRNVFAPQHHLVLEGNVGYGWIAGGDHRAEGAYGSALVQYVHSLDVADLRVTARWRDVLYPSALLREVVAGPGVHRTFAPGVFVDGDAYFRFGRQLDQPMVVPTGELELAPAKDSSGFELTGSVIADRRDDRIEPKQGWLLGATGSYSPGGPLGDHRWLRGTGDARAFVPLGAPNGTWSLALRASAGFVGLANDQGIPLGPRLFGGGAFGMRGFGRDQLSPALCAVAAAGAMGCDRVLVGGRSLVEGSVELRMLPLFKQYGAAMFVDAGQAAAGMNPFAEGISLAAGAGFRFRLWYVPVAFDLAYRIVDTNHTAIAWDRVLGFVRIGEAF